MYRRLLCFDLWLSWCGVSPCKYRLVCQFAEPSVALSFVMFRKRLIWSLKPQRRTRPRTMRRRWGSTSMLWSTSCTPSNVSELPLSAACYSKWTPNEPRLLSKILIVYSSLDREFVFGIFLFLPLKRLSCLADVTEAWQCLNIK